jgi:hypothetical protein
MREKIIVELPDYRIIIVSTYRSSNGKFYTFFFSKLEFVIEKMTSNGEKLISSSVCKMNFFLRESELKEQKNYS